VAPLADISRHGPGKFPCFICGNLYSVTSHNESEANMISISSKNAADRQRKRRERLRQAGGRQLLITLSADAASALAALAIDGSTPSDVVMDLLTSAKPLGREEPVPDPNKEDDKDITPGKISRERREVPVDDVFVWTMFS
jgi:hypothetical protein